MTYSFGTLRPAPYFCNRGKTPMTFKNRFSVILLGAAAIVASLSIIGCGDDGLSQRYAVSGTVTYKGAPLDKGLINFVPEAKEGRGAGGPIENGKYTLTTQDPGDGAFPGNYKVTVISKEDADEAAIKAATDKAAAKAGMTRGAGARVDEAAAGKAIKKAKSRIPEKYAGNNTPLKATVKPESNTFDFTLDD
jgi:hypothetical protein